VHEKTKSRDLVARQPVRKRKFAHNKGRARRRDAAYRRCRQRDGNGKVFPGTHDETFQIIMRSCAHDITLYLYIRTRQ